MAHRFILSMVTTRIITKQNKQKVMKSINIKIGILMMGLAFSLSTSAQKTIREMELITVNENVTTVITASEPVKFVDVSTDLVAADKPIENTVLLKPKEAHHDGDVLGIVTIIAERYRTQYALVYTTKPQEAVADKEIYLTERNAYTNPEVSMSTDEMTHLARRIWLSPSKYHNTVFKQNKMIMRLNNIYSVGEYFFIDFSVENKTNIRFDIDELRIKLADKKIQKSTNVQTIELTPALILDHSDKFLRGYRNVIVLKKLTFPNDKVLSIELSEKQISGRTLNMTIDYEDVLSADAFSNSLLEVK